MNILFLTLIHVTSIDERGIYTDLVRKFRDEGHHITVVAPVERRWKIKTNLKKIEGVSLLQVRTLNFNNTHELETIIAILTFDKLYLAAIKKRLRTTRFDLVYYASPPIMFCKVIAYLKQRDHAFTYLLLNDTYPQNDVNMETIKKGDNIHQRTESMETILYKLSDRIGCSSSFNMGYMIRNNPNVNSFKFEVNPNSISPIHISYNQAEKDLIKSKYGLPLDKKIFVYGGDLGVLEGVDFLLDTIAGLKVPEAHILIIGNGTHYTRVKAWFDTHQPTNASLLPGLRKDVYDALLAACDVGLTFTHKNFNAPNFSSRLLSYLEMKKPILAATGINTDIGKILKEAGCGYWLEWGDNKTMQEKIAAFCKEDLTAMGEKAWKLLQRDYTVDKRYKLMMERV